MGDLFDHALQKRMKTEAPRHLQAGNRDAAAQGAPFWFHILRKLVGIRPQSAAQSNKPA